MIGHTDALWRVATAGSLLNEIFIDTCQESTASWSHLVDSSVPLAVATTPSKEVKEDSQEKILDTGTSETSMQAMAVSSFRPITEDLAQERESAQSPRTSSEDPFS